MPVLSSPGQRDIFIPFPARRMDLQLREDQDRKLLKRVDYVHLSLVPWLLGRPGELPVRRGGALLSPALAARLDANERKVRPGSPLAGNPWDQGHVRPHVAVDRHTGAANLFTAGYTLYANDGDIRTGMMIGIVPRTPDAVELLSGCLDVLAETGIGGKRSSGSGGFSWEWADSPLPISLEPADGPTLSLLWPRPEECDQAPLQAPVDRGYRLVERFGWVHSQDWHGQLSRHVTMLGEGSFINPAILPIAGGLADVTPDPDLDGRHPVYRWGLGTFLAEKEVAG
jgi:CRISPR type III-A-associated RAMP protein Csm4